MSPFKTFTIKSESGLLKLLKTDCGACNPFDQSSGEIPSEVHNFTSLWDTGASCSVISKNVVDTLDLKPIGKAKVFHANGESIVNMYALNLQLPNSIATPFVKATEGIFNGFDLLIGMDIITLGDFSISNVGGKTTFSFRIPSIEEVDFMK